jgi:flagellin-like hook-associated protein FlgL
MKRISTNMPNTDMQFYMREREYRMNSVQNKMAGQTRILNLRDDPHCRFPCGAVPIGDPPVGTIQ